MHGEPVNNRLAVFLDSRFEDRSRAAEVGFLFTGVASAAQIAEIEVDVLHLRSAQVGVAEIGFADLLGRFEILLVKFIGIEARSAPFRSNRATNQAAARRTKVECAAVEVGIAEIGPFPINVSEAGARQIGLEEPGA